MKSTVITSDGQVACPKCGAVNSFTSKRTGKAKLLGVATLGVGVVAMPKRLKCNGCGANLTRGGASAPAAPVARTPHPNSISARRAAKVAATVPTSPAELAVRYALTAYQQATDDPARLKAAAELATAVKNLL